MVKRSSLTPDLPLLAWGNARLIVSRRRRQVAIRAGAIGVGIVSIFLTIIAPPSPRLVWNASASAPLGLYAVSPGAALARGDMVIARVPARFRMLAARRHYLPANVPLVKRVLGVERDRICALRATIFVNGKAVAMRKAADRDGRPMPRWSGCTRLGSHQLFLLMPDTPTSFDGRYFGITSPGDVIGKAHFLWAKPTLISHE